MQFIESEKSLFVSCDRKFYEGTPYFSIVIQINIPSGAIPVTVVVNANTGHVNLTKLFQDLQNGVRANQKAFLDFRYLKSVLMYIDTYSLLKYGHVHYTYNGHNIYNAVNDDDILRSDHTALTLHPDLMNKGKVVKSSLLQEVPNEIYGEKYNGRYNDCKGQYGDYHLIAKMMNYISPVYEIVNNAFIAFMLPIVSAKGETLLSTMNDPVMNIRSAIGKNTIQETVKHITETDEKLPIYDSSLQSIIAKKESSKGTDAEQWSLDYLKRFIPDIESCSNQPCSCDLYSPSLKIRVEVKCNNGSEKLSANEEKFHRDCHVHAEDTNVFVYLNLNPTTTAVSRVEINPLRFYINIADFNESIVKIIIETAKSYNMVHTVGNVSKITGNILIRDGRTMLREAISAELPSMIIDSFNDTVNMVKEEYKNEPMSERIKGRNARIDMQNENIERFFNEHRTEFIDGLAKGYTYDIYKQWCLNNGIQHLRYEEFNTSFARHCKDTRVKTESGSSKRIWRIPIRK